MEINHKAPSFCLKNPQQAKVCLKDIDEEWIVLYFYPKDNTPGCTTEAIDFSNLSKDFHEENCKIIGISPDTCESHSKFIEKKNLQIMLLADPDKKTLQKFGVWQLKKMYGKEYMGVIRTTFLLDEKRKIRYIWNKVKVKDHANIVFKKLLELKSSSGS